jgi:PTH1 family peptidyl-tRNA hydrolase
LLNRLLNRDAPRSEPDEQPWLVVGLGNPGPPYAGNRHNVGAMVVDLWAADLGERFSGHKTQADVAQVRMSPVGGLPGPRVVLAKPRTYMNESGGPVAGLMRFFKVPAERLIVVHDELDLPFAALRLKRDGGEGGHNGLRSVSRSLGTKDYCRLRIGIGRPPGRLDAADFVLRDFSTVERKELPFLLSDATDALDGVVRAGWERTQNTVNARA